MYDVLTARFTLSCPHGGLARVGLSAFRRLERLDGAAHPAVYRIRFACTCGEEHPALVTHAELDWEPLGLGDGRFLNLMTSRLDPLALELGQLSARRIAAGQWPWSFFCYPEERGRPVTPSAFLSLAPGGDSVGLAVRCPHCARISVNLVSSLHIELPFHHDGTIGVVPHAFGDADALAVEQFREQLDSGSFDVLRRSLY
ncbi:MAG: hypothetical protein H0T39_03010 [Actinobacteria bacterium]|nr:hypothetical protein [Actinomycetota bacterium]